MRQLATADDVAAAVLELVGPTSAMKLQKLVYYSQAWHLVWEDEPLFPEAIEAWANGPVVPALYGRHRGQFTINAWPHGDPTRLTEAERSSIQAVVDFYGGKSAAWLSQLTHSEDPWREARRGLAPGERSNRPISNAAMAEYYSTLIGDQ